VHLFSFSDNAFMSGMNKLIKEILKSIGANISGVATMINYGTAAVSVAMASPIFATISAPVGIICTLLSTSAGFADTMRSDAETEYSKILASKEIDKCVNMSYLGGCIGLYTAYACHEVEQPEDRRDVWNTYKKNYNGKTDAKARREGYATQDTTLKYGNMDKNKLGQGYSYSITAIDSVDTIQRLKNFTGEYYLYALALVGLDGSGFRGRISYISDNREEKIIDEYGVLYLGDLFKKN
jgi:hypothetical protein